MNVQEYAILDPLESRVSYAMYNVQGQSIHGIKFIFPLRLIFRNQNPNQTFPQNRIPIHPRMNLQKQLARILARPAQQLALPTRMKRDIGRDIKHLALVRRPSIAVLAAILRLEHRRGHADERRGQVCAAQVLLRVGGFGGPV